MTASVYLSEHIRTLVMIYLAFIVHDVRAKMEANDVKEYQKSVMLFRKYKLTAYWAVIIASVIQITSYVLRAYNFSIEANIINDEIGVTIDFIFIVIVYVFIFMFVRDIKFFKKMQTAKARNEGLRSLPLNQILVFLLIDLIAVCIAASFLLRINYTLLVLIHDLDYDGGTLVHWVSEYIGFVGMNILDFIVGMAFLYLFNAMGVKQLREEAPKEVSGLTSINNVLEQEDYDNIV